MPEHHQRQVGRRQTIAQAPTQTIAGAWALALRWPTGGVMTMATWSCHDDDWSMDYFQEYGPPQQVLCTSW